MEYLLMELFGGGTADWQMIGETRYDWADIVEIVKMEMGIENAKFSDFLRAIFELAQDEFYNMIEVFVKDFEDNEEYKGVIEKLKKFDFTDEEIWYKNLNYLDNDLIITVNEEIAEILNEYFEEDINKINDNIGFTYIQINVE